MSADIYSGFDFSEDDMKTLQSIDGQRLRSVESTRTVESDALKMVAKKVKNIAERKNNEHSLNSIETIYVLDSDEE